MVLSGFGSILSLHAGLHQVICNRNPRQPRLRLAVHCAHSSWLAKRNTPLGWPLPFASKAAVACSRTKRCQGVLCNRPTTVRLNFVRAQSHRLDFRPRLGHFADVSVTELQNRIQKLSPGERRSVGKYVSYVTRRNSTVRQRQLARINREMSAGKKYTQAQVDATLARHPSKP